MAQRITPAGFIVAGEMAIFGLGKTEESAWENFLAEMKMAQVTIRDEDNEDEIESGANTVHVDDFTILPATQALLDRVESHGGNIYWAKINGVCCTEDEEQEAE